MRHITSCVCLFAMLLGCGNGARTTLPDQTALTDINPDPNIVEVQLVATPSTKEYLDGKVADVWAYRDGAVDGSQGTIPGPMLEAKRGDLIVVHFRNELPDPTTIHWHGLRLPAKQDGSNVSQTAIPPGGSYEYRFTALDPGSFWFHPHIRAHEQVEKGLYAPLIIHGEPLLTVAADRYLVLDDVKLRGDGKLDDATDPLDIMLGRPGNVLLVNGKRNGRLVTGEGTMERWRILNAANGRYFNLSLPGHKFYVIGWDGGLLPLPYVTDTLLIAPGERYEVLMMFEHPPAGRLALQNIYYDRGHSIPDPGPQDLFEIVYGPPGPSPGPLPNLAKVAHIAVDPGARVRPFVLREEEDPSGMEGATFSINNERWPTNTPIRVKSGDVEIWEIQANVEMDHPFHLHGMFFEVLSVDGVPPVVPFGWKDTVNVPRGKKLRFAVKLDPPGKWMFHCHILEHAERGMMGELMID